MFYIYHNDVFPDVRCNFLPGGVKNKLSMRGIKNRANDNDFPFHAYTCVFYSFLSFLHYLLVIHRNIARILFFHGN